MDMQARLTQKAKKESIRQQGNPSWKRASKTCAGAQQEDKGAVAAVEVVDGGKALLAADRAVQPLVAETTIAQIVLCGHGDGAYIMDGDLTVINKVTEE